MVRHIYLAMGWGIVLLGATHMFATTRLFSGVTPRALWFFSGGIAMALTGALNLLNRSYGTDTPGLRRVCVGANVMMTLFGAVSGAVNNATVAEFIIVLGLMGSATVLSVLKTALLPAHRHNVAGTAT